MKKWAEFFIVPSPLYLTFSNIAPGDSGYIEWTLENNGSLDGDLTVTLTRSNDVDTTINEPESATDGDGSDAVDAYGHWEGDETTNPEDTIFVDDGDNQFNAANDTVIAGKTPGEDDAALASVPNTWKVASIDDTDDAGAWDAVNDTIFVDEDGDNEFDTGEAVIAGKTPDDGTAASAGLDGDWGMEVIGIDEGDLDDYMTVKIEADLDANADFETTVLTEGLGSLEDYTLDLATDLTSLDPFTMVASDVIKIKLTWSIAGDVVAPVALGNHAVDDNIMQADGIQLDITFTLEQT